MRVNGPQPQSAFGDEYWHRKAGGGENCLQPFRFNYWFTRGSLAEIPDETATLYLCAAISP